MISYSRLGLILLCAGVQLLVGGCRKQKEAAAVRKLLSKDMEQIAEGRDYLLAAGRTKSSTARLINLIEDKENRTENQNGVEVTMFILGEMKAEEAVPVLVEHIGYPHYCTPGEGPAGGAPGFGYGQMVRRLSEYQRIFPAVEALTKIGEPCLDEVASGLRATKSIDGAKPYLAVLVGLKGRDSVVGMLENAVEEEADSRREECRARTEPLIDGCDC